MNNQDLAKLLLRLGLGVLVLMHGIAKVINGVGSIKAMLASNHLPAFLAYGVYVGEVVAPVMILLGYYTRLGAGLIAVNMLFAFGLAHMGQLYQLGKTGGWALELQGMYLICAIALALLGPGRYKMHS